MSKSWWISLTILARPEVILVPLVIMIVGHSSDGFSQSQRPSPEDFNAASGIHFAIPFPYVGPLEVEALEVAPSVVGNNIRVNQDATRQPQNETSIAINPVNLNNLIGGANDYRGGDTQCGSYSSSNSAASWTDGVLSLVAGFTVSGDPGVAFDADSNAYFLCMNFTRVPGNDATQFVHKSLDHGLTWGPAVLAAGSPMAHFDDKGHIAVDDISSTPHKNNIYVSFTRISPLEIRFNRSTNGGASFVGCPSACADFRLNDVNPGVVQGSSITVGVDGAVYVGWADNNRSGTSRIMIDKSTDGGASFGALAGGVDHVVRTFSAIGNPDLGKRVRPLGRVNSFPVIKADSCNANRIYAVWAEDPVADDDSDVMFARSTDGGNTWSAPIRINDDINPIGDFHSQFFPWMAVDPSTCEISIVWYDDRDDDNRSDLTPLVNLYFASSKDGGLSFSANVRISNPSSNPLVQFGGFFGDYNGIDARGGVAFPFWTDSRTGDQDVMTASVVTEDVTTVVNDVVTFDPLISTFKTSLDTTGCPATFAGQFSFDAKLANVSGSSLAGLVAQVATLTGDSLLQNADEGPGGVGSRLTIPKKDDFSDGLLSPGEFVDVPFVICLKQIQPFELLVDILGVVDSGPVASIR
jgi:hypothetical protein